MHTDYNDEIGLTDRYEIGLANRYEIGAEESQPEAVREVIRVAASNRQPAPPMRVVEEGAPLPDRLAEACFPLVCDEVASAIGVANPFPLTTKLLTRFGAAMEQPRFVRVDTAASYAAFRAANSPEMAEFRARLDDLTDRFVAHAHDPDAHRDLLDEADEIEAIGAAAAQAEQAREIDMWLPERIARGVHKWRQGPWICASIKLPGADGEVRICTAMTDAAQAEAEMETHAAAANVPAAHVVGVLPAMGHVLGAGTLLKEMAAAAPEILRRPEAGSASPWICRIEPAASPALCAFATLLLLCAQGNQQACAEWDALAAAAGKCAPPVQQVMQEARTAFLNACSEAM